MKVKWVLWVLSLSIVVLLCSCLAGFGAMGIVLVAVAEFDLEGAAYVEVIPITVFCGGALAGGYAGWSMMQALRPASRLEVDQQERT